MGGVTVPCLIDTGSMVTTITESFFQEHFHHLQKKDCKWLGLKAANGLDIPYIGYIEEHCSRLLAAMENASHKSTLSDFYRQYDERCSLSIGSALRIARMLMHDRALIPNLESADLAAASMANFTVVTRRGQLRMVGGI